MVACDPRQERVCNDERTDPEMTLPKPALRRRDRQLEQALDHARHMSEPRPQDQCTPAWWAQASWVGDLTALAAADLARSLRG
jgi:hypothetical protein